MSKELRSNSYFNYYRNVEICQGPYVWFNHDLPQSGLRHFAQCSRTYSQYWRRTNHRRIFEEPAVARSAHRFAGITPRKLLRQKGTPYFELNLEDESLSDAALLDAMLAHSILINRPIVETSVGTRLRRPSEVVLAILAVPQLHAFEKEKGEKLVDDKGGKIERSQ